MTQPTRKCSIDGCDAVRDCRGYCRKHYQDWRRQQPAIPCKVEGCDARSNSPGCAKGYCAKHYWRFSKHGDPEGGRPQQGASLSTRVKRLTRIDPTTGCWVWQGSVNHAGYGRMTWKGAQQQAHRVTYMEFKGEIPEGFHVDHLCCNRACVNPDHLEAVTGTENNRRRDERMYARDAERKRSRLKPPYLMPIDEFLAWAAGQGIELDDIRISHGFALEPEASPIPA